MDKKEQIERTAPKVSRNLEPIEDIKSDERREVNIYEYIFTLELTSPQKFILLFLASETNYSIKLSFKKFKNNKIHKNDYCHLIFIAELEHKLGMSSRYIKILINELVNLHYIYESESDPDQHDGKWYQLSGKSFKNFYNEGFL